VGQALQCNVLSLVGLLGVASEEDDPGAHTPLDGLEFGQSSVELGPNVEANLQRRAG
jgi:hypothetical protein